MCRNCCCWTAVNEADCHIGWHVWVSKCTVPSTEFHLLFLCYWPLNPTWDCKIEKGFVERYISDFIGACRINCTAICSRSLCLEPSWCWMQVSMQTYETLKRTVVGNTGTSSLSFLYKEFVFAGLAARQKDCRLEYNLCCGWKCVFGTWNCVQSQPQHWRLHIENSFLFCRSFLKTLERIIFCNQHHYSIQYVMVK